MRVLVTGALGFIGGWVSLRLSEAGYEVYGVDNGSRSTFSVEELSERGVRVELADLREVCRLEDIFRSVRPNVVIHAAAYVSAEESLRDPVLYAENNVISTVSVLRASVTFRVSRFVYLSSAAVYGIPRYLPVDEDHPLDPVTPYGASKLAGEVFVTSFSKAYGIEYVILRLFNVYGPRQSADNPYSGVVARFVSRASKGLPPIIYGSGEQTRDFVHVLDVCRAVELSMKTAHTRMSYNIGTGKPTTIGRLARLVIEMSGLDLEPVHMPQRPGDIPHSYADITRARRYLGWEPSISLDEGLRQLFLGRTGT